MKFQYRHPTNSDPLLLIIRDKSPPLEHGEYDSHTGTRWDEDLKYCMEHLASMGRGKVSKRNSFSLDVLNDLLDSLINEEDSIFWKDSGTDIKMDSAGITEHLVKGLLTPKYFGKTHQLTTTLYRLSQDSTEGANLSPRPKKTRWGELTITVKLSRGPDYEDEDEDYLDFYLED